MRGGYPSKLQRSVVGCASEGSACLREAPPCGTKAGPTKHVEEPRALARGAPLWAASGVNRPDSGKRTAPSAVNWQELDIYVATAEGLYLYDAKSHRLNPILSEDIRALTGRQPFVREAPVNLVYVADFSRMGRGTNEEKEFYPAADTGFIAQNVYLFCSSEGLATVVRASIDRPALAKVMKLRPDQKITLAQSVGYPTK